MNTQSNLSHTRRVKFTYCANDPLPMSDIKRSENLSDLLKTLTDMVNVNIDNNVFPWSEKRAIVKPIVKGKLDPQCLNSFRPVSNVMFLSKIVEKVILDQLMDHLQLVNVLLLLSIEEGTPSYEESSLTPKRPASPSVKE